MISLKKIGVVLGLAVAIIGSITFFYKKNDVVVRDVNIQKDFKDIEALFHKGDNWWWMICNAHLDTYSLEHTIKHRSSSQYEWRYDLIMKVLEVKGAIAGFSAYYPESKHCWRLLFLIVDQDFRRQGIAKKLLTYVMKDMVARGALKVDLVTRCQNIRSQGLYTQFGFKKIGQGEEQVSMTWRVDWGIPVL